VQESNPTSCPECDRLWRSLGEIALRNFRLEERLRRAQERQDCELAKILAEKLANLVREHESAYRALLEHEQRDHLTKSACSTDQSKT
jgi:hypothetical protein